MLHWIGYYSFINKPSRENSRVNDHYMSCMNIMDGLSWTQENHKFSYPIDNNSY